MKKQMKKHILQENYERFFGKREFGDPLPTFKGVMKKHQQINEDKGLDFLKKMGHMKEIFGVNPSELNDMIGGMLHLDGLGMKRWKTILKQHKVLQREFDKFVKVVKNEYSASGKES